jgi:hypothetical protein
LGLRETELHKFSEQGYLLVEGLIPDEVVSAAAARVWTEMGGDPHDESTWAAARANAYRPVGGPEITACYSQRFLAIACALAGEAPGSFQADGGALAINTFPSDGEWEWPKPHIDHAIKEHGHRTFPRAFRIATLTYLSDGESHGGVTVVWPGSHRKIEALAKSDPVRYELMWTLNLDIGRAGLGEPLEVIPKRGDVLFYHTYCAHAGSKNVRKQVRLAINRKW